MSSLMKSTITTFVPESKGSFPSSLQSMIERRTDKKLFGCLEITAPDSDVSQQSSINYLFGIVVDNSSSMQGDKLHHALETIKNLSQIMSEKHDEPHQFWMYLITFNSKAKLVIPLTEITPATLPSILESLETIQATGCTNYHAAFQLQNEVLSDIVQKMSSEKPLHLVRFFLTDGEITEGSRNVHELYDMMRFINARSSTPQLRLSTRDVVFGYGKDIKLECLQALSAQKHPVSDETSCSSLVTIMRPQDIGLKVGETVYSILNNFGANVTVSINGGVAAVVELFDYRQREDQVWGSSILLPSINCGDSHRFLFQCPPVQTCIVTIKWDNLFTGQSHSHECTHDMQSEPMEPGKLFLQQVLLVLGMMEIEISKQMMAAETKLVPSNQIVQNAYQTIRQLKELDAILSPDNEELKCHIIKLLTDARFIVGLTTISSPQEQNLALWDRRICSGGNEVVNSCVKIVKIYVLGEENYEVEATAAIKDHVPTHVHESDFHDEYEESDYIPSLLVRMPTAMPQSSHTQRYHNGSQLRKLCALIATARRNGDNTSAKDLLVQMHQRPYDYECDDDPLVGNDDTFSSIPSDDPRRRRFGLILQMSSDPQRSDTSGSYVNINVDASSSGGFVMTDPSTPSKRVCQSDNVSSS
jgi:hypothetical protein